MKFRLVTSVAAFALAVAVATGCSPQPAPEPTPAFTSEEEAFAAAEATYRAYVDALNQVDLSDPETFEPVYAWTTGEANAGERRSLSRMHADGWVVSGETKITAITQKEYNPDPPEVALAVCTDVSGVDVRDASGASQVGADRPAIQSAVVALDRAEGSSTGFLISKVEGSDAPC
ncbi:hypothetical protein [Microbacterium sp. BK668]|uniref:hypothetical protein n=1 Tax=Microbacterium sp. BK668 TaxID=2512118 RepID=UPI00106000E3|nr:hypothetical protein [Microbacterium sp. BK668]TDN93151.1 hypothetical protein EV279_2694 [Microbacterium sp. BK668]